MPVRDASRSAASLAGFQLTARANDDGAQAGTLAPALGEEPRVGIEGDGRIQYAGQQKGTTLPTREAARWSLGYTAVAESSPR